MDSVIDSPVDPPSKAGLLAMEDFQYPLAAAPDIIRSNQKDTYFQDALLENLSKVLRKLYGVRFTHNYAHEVRTLTDLVYFGCTTFIGNRTLGEEYCDIIQVECHSMRLPSMIRRSVYIVSTVLTPYMLGKALPALRARLRRSLELSLSRYQCKDETAPSSFNQFCSYILENLSTLISPSLLYALSLSIFYFNGGYYHLSKRFAGLKYVFTKRIEASDQRMGYEVLGVLLMLQMTVQGWLHIRKTLEDNALAFTDSSLERSQASDSTTQAARITAGIINNTHTPTTEMPKYTLFEAKTLGWIDGLQQRKCTLCLEELKDPSVTTCGHVFCWKCITDWIREKPECPLCRQAILRQHVLPIRG